MEGHGRPWKAMEGHGRPWKAMKGHGRPWKVSVRYLRGARVAEVINHQIDQIDVRALHLADNLLSRVRSAFVRRKGRGKGR